MAEDTPKIPTVFDTEKAKLGDVYAKALLGFGETSGGTEALLGELSGVVDVMEKLPKLRAVLESPRVANDEKTKVLEKAFGGKLSKDLVNFLKVVSSKGRVDCLGQISESARRLYDEVTGKVMAEVTTAEAVEQSVIDDIAKQLEEELGNKVTVHAVVDPSIIGGMVIRIGDTVHDASVVNQLNQARTKAVKSVSDAIRGSLDRFIGA